MKFTARLQKHIDHSCREVIDDEHPVPVDTVGGQENRAFEGSSHPGDEGLLLGAPGREGADPHGHQRVAAVLAGEKPLPAAVTGVVRDADEAVMVGKGVGHA
jgi:hypothetical protein